MQYSNMGGMMRGTTRFLALCGVAMTGMLSTAGAPRDAGAVAGPVVARALPGDLPRPIDQMTGAELWAFGNGLGYDNGPVQGRDCARGACMGRIDAVSGQTPGASTISPNGTVVARLVNLGRGGNGADEGSEQRYGTQRDGPTRFYLIALRSGDGWRWTVREAAPNASSMPRETTAGTWVTCAHDPSTPGHPKGRSEFASCTPQSGEDDLARTSGPRVAIAGAGTLAAYGPRDPGWLSCTDGCCTAGM